MSKMRTSTHRGRSGAAKHNEHNFMEDEKDISGHVFVGKAGQSLEERELYFYKYHFAEQLSRQNERYVRNRQFSRTKSPEQFYKSKRYKPVEEIYQLGNKDMHPDDETYEKIIDDFYRWKLDWSESHGGNLIVLSYVNHFDETTPHTHGREVWQAKKDGIWIVSQELGMEQAGIQLPDPTKPVGRYNNRNMTYTAMCRSKFQEICIEHGFEIETVPIPRKEKHLTVQEYQKSLDRDYFEKREKELLDREQELSNKNAELNEMMRLAEEREEKLDLEKRQYRALMNKANESTLLRKEHELNLQYKMKFYKKMRELNIDITEFKEWIQAKKNKEHPTVQTQIDGLDTELDDNK